MTSETEPIPIEGRPNQQVDNAIRAIKDKKPLPEIDFTIHTMEDGTQASTMERVCKGLSPLKSCALDRGLPWPRALRCVPKPAQSFQCIVCS